MKKRVCMTGTGHKSRAELTKELEDMGYQVVNYVNSQTDILLCEDKSGDSVKLQNARKLGISIMTYNEIF